MKASLSIPCKRIRIIQRTCRRRSPHYAYARSALMDVVDLGAENLDLDRVVGHYENWRAHYEDKFIHLFKDPGDHIFLKSVCRFDPPYRSVLKRRMRKLRKIRWDVKLEITLDPKNFIGLFDEFEFLPGLWNVVNVWLRRNFGDLEFLRILEITKKGRPHLHVLVAFHDPKWAKFFRNMNRRDKKKRFEAFYHEFKDVVARNGGGWVWVRPIKGEIRLVNYALKYVNKSISGDNKEYSALLFSSNRRLFGISRGLKVFSDPKRSPQGYAYLGCVLSNSLEAFCRERGVPFGLCVRVDGVDSRLVYEWPLLFDMGGDLER